MMPELAFFCWVYLQLPGHPCIRGAWLPSTTIVMPGTYDNEDEPIRKHARKRRSH